MGSETRDILVDIPDEDLPKLAEMYKPYKNQLPEVYGIIITGIEWKKKRKGKYMTFMSPNDCWRKDGTFFVLLAHYSFDIFIFSLDESGKSIYEGVRKTTRFNTGDYTDKYLLLDTVHSKFYPTIMKALSEQGKTLIEEYRCCRVSIPREEALKFEISCPPEAYIKKLDGSHAETVNSAWPHHYKNSVKYVTLLIEMNESYGIFLKSTDELVAWAIVCMLGQISMVQTVDIHKRKGYASLIVKYTSKQIAQKGHNPFATVLVHNVPSIGMFKKIGFKDFGLAFFADVKQ